MSSAQTLTSSKPPAGNLTKMPNHGIILASHDPVSQVETWSIMTVSGKMSPLMVPSLLEACSTVAERGERRPTTPNPAVG